MKKIILVFKRKPGMTPEQFRDYYEQHAERAIELLPFFKGYRRNYVRHDLAYRPAHLEDKPVGPDFDVITEMTFETDSDYEKMVQALASPEILKETVEDMERFTDRSCVQMFFVDEVTTPPATLERWKKSASRSATAPP